MPFAISQVLKLEVSSQKASVVGNDASGRLKGLGLEGLRNNIQAKNPVSRGVLHFTLF